MRIPFSEIMACRTSRELSDKINEVLARFSPDDPPCLSDCLVNVDRGGHHINLALANKADMDDRRKLPDNMRFKWKIQVLRDEWGNKVKPGDKVTRTVKLPYEDESGNIVGGDDLSRMIADGTYKERFELTYDYIVDDKGCIECDYHDTVHFISLWGIHSKTRVPMTTKPEHSVEPVRCPNGGMKHVWYWRFREVPKDEYEEMPSLTEDSKSKKGYNK